MYTGKDTMFSCFKNKYHNVENSAAWLFHSKTTFLTSVRVDTDTWIQIKLLLNLIPLNSFLVVKLIFQKDELHLSGAFECSWRSAAYPQYYISSIRNKNLWK